MSTIDLIAVILIPAFLIAITAAGILTTLTIRDHNRAKRIRNKLNGDQK